MESRAFDTLEILIKMSSGTAKASVKDSTLL